MLTRILTVGLALACAPLALAQAAPDGSPVPPAKDCPLCKLPNRAALFAGVAGACPKDCAKLCCTGTEITYLVRGMKGDPCSGKVRTALDALDGVTVSSVSHQSRLAVLRFDPATITPSKLISAINATGFEVTGERASFKIPTMTNEVRAAMVEAALLKIEAVTRIQTVCSKTSHAVVVFDPARTTREKIAAAINGTRFKVAADD